MFAETVRENPEPLDTGSQVTAVSARPARVVLITSMAALLGAIVWLGFSARGVKPAMARFRPVRLLTIDRPFPAEGRFVQDPYVGPQIARSAIPGKRRLHSRSGHARTLAPAGRRAIGGSMELSWPIPSCPM